MSSLVFGTWNLSRDWGGYSQKSALKLLEVAFSLGLNTFDTSPLYGNGESESYLGQCFGSSLRSRVFLASKFGLVRRGRSVSNVLSPQSVNFEFEGTLRRLCTTYLDAYFLHKIPCSRSLEGVLPLLLKWKNQGVIRQIGVCNWEDIQALDKDLVPYIDVVQNRYNALQTESLDVLDFCQQKGIEFWAYSPLAQGLLMGTYTLKELYDMEHPWYSQRNVRRFNPLFGLECRKQLQKTLVKIPCGAENAFRFLAKQGINKVVVGTRQIIHLKELVKIFIEVFRAKS